MPNHVSGEHELRQGVSTLAPLKKGVSRMAILQVELDFKWHGYAASFAVNHHACDGVLTPRGVAVAFACAGTQARW
jgi:hypothetical protein